MRAYHMDNLKCFKALLANILREVDLGRACGQAKINATLISLKEVAEPILL